jgi:hypothetical protein
MCRKARFFYIAIMASRLLQYALQLAQAELRPMLGVRRLSSG